MKFISSSALVLSLLVVSAPLAAFADESVNASGTVQVQVNGNDGSGKGAALGGLREDIHGLLASGTGENNGSNGEHRASSTNPGLHLGQNRVGSTSAKANIGPKIRARGDSEIDARITNLDKIIARLGDATRLSPEAKASLNAQLTAQITALTNLKAQIDSGATTTLKANTESITKNFRIYSLVLPKAAITAAADRIMTIVAQMETLSGKITARITAASAAGATVTAATAAHADFDAKVADAKLQAQAAANEVVNLSADAGATTTAAANTAALKDAKTKIDAAQADVKAARKDIGTILAALKGTGEIEATSTASVH